MPNSWPATAAVSSNIRSWPDSRVVRNSTASRMPSGTRAALAPPSRGASASSSTANGIPSARLATAAARAGPGFAPSR